MNKRIAVIDLGTNTFHLLIAERGAAGVNELVRKEVAVKLGEGGINEGLIQPAAFERGLAALRDFHSVILQHEVEQVRALATSALRNAANGHDFIGHIKNETGIKIEIIDGDAEAEFIFRGIKAAGCLSDKDSLIVDIGGGSVEFIICDKDRLKWKRSFEIGAARLMDRFHHRDPIAPESITAQNIYLEDVLKPLFAAVSGYEIKELVGSSGVFETYAALAESDKDKAFDPKKTTNYTFDKDQLLTILEKIVLSTHQQRAGNTLITPVRVDMIVTASILTRFIIEKLGIEKVGMSTNSLKEGALAEMMG